jgi:hypothetical protein
VLPDQNKSLEQQDWSEHLPDGEKPTSEQHQKPLLHHPLPTFPSVTRTERRDAHAALSLSWSKTFPVSGQVRERTSPALNRNKLADRSLQINLICE